MFAWKCLLFLFIRSGQIESQVSLNFLIIHKTRFFFYTDVVCVFLSHQNQDTNVIICVIKLEDFILKLSDPQDPCNSFPVKHELPDVRYTIVGDCVWTFF